MKTDPPPDTKSAEQSDEDVLRQEGFKKGKKKVIGERQNAHLLIQKYSDGEMQVFVRGICYQESKRLYGKCVSSPDFMDDFMCLANRFNAVFDD